MRVLFNFDFPSSGVGLVSFLPGDDRASNTQLGGAFRAFATIIISLKSFSYNLYLVLFERHHLKACLGKIRIIRFEHYSQDRNEFGVKELFRY